MGAECERLQKSIAELEAENADWKRRHAKYRDMHADAELRLLEAKVRFRLLYRYAERNAQAWIL